MTREEFCALPLPVALGVLYDVAHSRLCTMPVPPGATTPATSPAPAGDAPEGTPARPPRFDAKLSRQGGFAWMSEMLLPDLEWWREKKLEGAAKGGQYAERDRKTAGELERFIAWRRVDPGSRWSGVRGDKRVTAAVPRRDPELHPWPDRAPARLAPRPPAGGFSDADYGGGDEEAPF